MLIVYLYIKQTETTLWMSVPYKLAFDKPHNKLDNPEGTDNSLLRMRESLQGSLSNQDLLCFRVSRQNSVLEVQSPNLSQDTESQPSS